MPNLYDTTGVLRTYYELAEQTQNRYAATATLENFNARATEAQQALDHLAADLAEANVDVVIVVGDDQLELFNFSNMPAFAMFYGDKLLTHHIQEEEYPGMDSDFLEAMRKGYRMDAQYELNGQPELARELIKYLTKAGIDIAACGEVAKGHSAGFGHAYGFIYERLMLHKKIPMIPVMVNAFYEPNQPTPARCYELGRALRAGIEASAANLRVAIVASGGLSHFVTNEELDHTIIRALKEGDRETLKRIPSELLNSGSGEIRNWLTVAGAVEGMKLAWYKYLPVYRSAAGTGVGMGFARWS
jgi:aromatic ring-opening dioxygenase catalytic subunit (LigB family)